ncbi:hypothetical protein OsJ_11806 [Oryza sativa Japonica Group]|uniref:GTPase regulator protein n=3 Tax=Oryza TaxID=4527 RepID=A0A979HJK3_ORYSJ|nr:putative GTPase regulator protein [Oryza sativa Japonica Group]ABF97727.1 hypothetical protein LOC_Os03g42920 [Oryza sativa Japonica Group]EAZ27852.1 hypothetical protein OsJ_11806 [Oryza sativa Japonica Group]
MATAVERRRGRRLMGRRTWRRWREEAMRRRGLMASRQRRVEARRRDATHWRRGRGRRTVMEGAHKAPIAGEADGDEGGSQAGVETWAGEKAARAAKKGFDGGSGEGDGAGGGGDARTGDGGGEGDERRRSRKHRSGTHTNRGRDKDYLLPTPERAGRDIYMHANID